MANYHNTQVFIDDRRYNLKYSIVKSIEEYVESVNMYNGGSSSVIRETKKNTYERKKSDLKKFLNFLETKNYDIKYTIHINQLIIEEYTKYLYMLKKPDGSEYSINSRNSFFTSFKSYLTYLATKNAIKREAYQYIDNHNIATRSKKSAQIESEIGFLHTHQITKLYNNIDKYYKANIDLNRNKALFMLLLHGFRRDEIRNLKWNDINFEKSTARIYSQKTSKVNTVYLNTDTMNALKEHRNVLTADLLTFESYVFAGYVNQRGKMVRVGYKQICENTIANMIRTIAEDEKDSEGKEITARTFRKTFTVVNLSLGNKLTLIQTYTKHTLPVLQKNYSTYFANEELNPRQAIEKYFNNIFNRRDTSLDDLKIEDIVSNTALNEKLKKYYFNLFMQTLKKI